MSRVAVVTGANKGIGYAAVKLLAKQFDGVIYLTSRNEKLGAEALDKIKKEAGGDGAKIKYHQLDITDKSSVTKFRDFLKKEHGGIDVLINNAGFAFKAGEIALTLLQQREMAKDNRQDIVVNAVRAQGYVDTDMSSHKGHLTPEEGADTLIYLALLAPNVETPRGEFLAERKIIDWANYVMNFSDFVKKS